jgi:hypothetical protein
MPADYYNQNLDNFVLVGNAALKFADNIWHAACY